jgi:hypothetical protein
MVTVSGCFLPMYIKGTYRFLNQRSRVINSPFPTLTLVVLAPPQLKVGQEFLARYFRDKLKGKTFVALGPRVLPDLNS